MPLKGKMSFTITVWPGFKIQSFSQGSVLSENLISAKWLVLGMQFKTIAFLCYTLHLSPSVPLYLIMFFFFSVPPFGVVANNADAN